MKFNKGDMVRIKRGKYAGRAGVVIDVSASRVNVRLWVKGGGRCL